MNEGDKLPVGLRIATVVLLLGIIFTLAGVVGSALLFGGVPAPFVMAFMAGMVSAWGSASAPFAVRLLRTGRTQ